MVCCFVIVCMDVERQDGAGGLAMSALNLVSNESVTHSLERQNVYQGDAHTTSQEERLSKTDQGLSKHDVQTGIQKSQQSNPQGFQF